MTELHVLCGTVAQVFPMLSALRLGDMWKKRDTTQVVLLKTCEKAFTWVAESNFFFFCNKRNGEGNKLLLNTCTHALELEPDMKTGV